MNFIDTPDMQGTELYENIYKHPIVVQDRDCNPIVIAYNIKHVRKVLPCRQGRTLRISPSL